MEADLRADAKAMAELLEDHPYSALAMWTALGAKHGYEATARLCVEGLIASGDFEPEQGQWWRK